MRNGLAAFHDPYDRSLCLKVSVCGNTLVCRLVLLFGFLQLDLVDLDPHLLVLKLGIVRKHVSLVDLFAFGLFKENAVFSTC